MLKESLAIMLIGQLKVLPVHREGRAQGSIEHQTLILEAIEAGAGAEEGAVSEEDTEVEGKTIAEGEAMRASN